MESIKQKKTAELIKSQTAEYFLLKSAIDYSKAFISVTEVKLTADLSIAKVYISIMPSDKYDKKIVFKKIEEDAKLIRKYVGNSLAKKIRKIPELRFYLDEGLDLAERIEQLLKK